MTLKQLEKRVQARLEEINGGESSPQGLDEQIEAAYLEQILWVLDNNEEQDSMESVCEQAYNTLTANLWEVVLSTDKSLGSRS